MFTEATSDRLNSTKPDFSDGIMQTAKLDVRLAKITPETSDISAFEFTHPDGADLPPFTAGAHIEVHLGDGQVRSYSLCNDPAERHRYVVAVLREQDGRGGSLAMHDRLKAGDTVTISGPRNHFALAGREATFHLLLAGGIGVTPMVAMIAELEARGAQWHMHYCTRSPERTAFRDQLAPYVAAGKVTLHHDGGDPSRGLDLAGALGDFAPGTHVYFCGPAGFMTAAKGSVGAWPPHAVHFEHFTAPEDDGTVHSNSAFRVKLKNSGKEVEVPADKSILEVLRDEGLTIDSECEDGFCGTCITRILAGEPDHRDSVLSDGERKTYMMICCSRAKGDVLKLDL